MSAEKNNGGSFAAGALLGALIGAAVAMVATPESGKVVRRKIKGLVNKYLEEGHEVVDNVEAAVSEIAGGVKDAAEPMIKETTKKAKDLKKQMFSGLK